MCLSVCLFVCVSVVCLSDIPSVYRSLSGKGARREVQGDALSPTWILFSSFFAEHSLFMHRVGHRDTVSLFSTECNMTAGVGIPQVDTRQICPSTLDYSLWVCTTLEKILRAPILSGHVHPTNSPKLHLLPSLDPQLFLFKLKMLLFSKSYPDSSSSPCLSPCLNSKYHPP